ncbi:uncharacterized protein LY89DRAFT_687475 [Mollisia scopiformis]|uniref:CCHC-type domain-containing protein n=1 Tax=Mollisia scopiformis TaxID=149040 RepID=A0A194WZD6_MOLSC|nr:uncharacterized protein LY89DRAFT_687475 [Mollisia scopiformis]KUJ13316.1 hypothetical protein LY89DRAFT_687475 [Mollisia scopiformis]
MSISPVPAQADEAAHLSQLPPAPNSSAFTMLEVGSDEGRLSMQASSDASRPQTTWNTGVQSGLRTSFAAKGKGKPIVQAREAEDTDSAQDKSQVLLPVDDEDHSIAIENSDRDDKSGKKRRMRNTRAEEYDTTDAFVDDSGLGLHASNGLPASETLSGFAAPPQPFRPLNKRRLAALPEEERGVYRSALNDWLVSNKKAKKAAKRAVLAASNIPDTASMGMDDKIMKQQQGPSTSAFNAKVADDMDENESESDQDDSESEEDDDDVDEADLRISQIPANISPALLASIGPAPKPPQPVQALKPGQKNRLNKNERKKYKRARLTFLSLLSKYRIARREYDAKLGIVHSPRALPPDFRNNPKRLTKREVTELTMQDQMIYAEVMESHLANNKLKRRDKAHADAKKALMEYKHWPLPNLGKYQKISANIRKGKTWYPREPKKKKGRVFLSYNCNGKQYPLPPIFDTDGIPIALQDMSFNIFVAPFLKENKENWHLLDQRTLKEAFNHYLTTYYMQSIGYAPRVRKTADAPDAIKIHAAMQQIEPTWNLSGRPSAKVAAVPAPSTVDLDGQSFAQQVTVAPADSATTSMDIAQSAFEANHDIMALDSEQDSLEDPEMREALMFLQQKYYPSASNAIRCLVCAKIGHTSDACPALNCLICDVEGKHSTLMCPRDLPCGKCRARGHARNECPEKLAMPKADMTCDLCGARNHVETECSRIWRSFEPSPNEIVVVSGIPVHCYTCGGGGHYGPECGLFQGRVLSGDYTWSTANLKKYLDSSSRNRAISAPVDYTLPPKPTNQHNYSIKGQANDPISLDSDDDQQFIRPLVRSGNAPRGNITFANQGQAPQAPSRSSGGQGQMSLSMRNSQPKRGGKKGHNHPPPRAVAGPDRGRRSAKRRGGKA